MPYYTFVNLKSGKTVEPGLMTISEGEAWIKANPGWDYAPALPSVGDPDRRRKPSDNFRQNLRRIKKFYKDSNVNDF